MQLKIQIEIKDQYITYALSAQAKVEFDQKYMVDMLKN